MAYLHSTVMGKRVAVARLVSGEGAFRAAAAILGGLWTSNEDDAKVFWCVKPEATTQHLSYGEKRCGYGHTHTNTLMCVHTHCAKGCKEQLL